LRESSLKCWALVKKSKVIRRCRVGMNGGTQIRKKRNRAKDEIKRGCALASDKKKKGRGGGGIFCTGRQPTSIQKTLRDVVVSGGKAKGTWLNWEGGTGEPPSKKD